MLIFHVDVNMKRLGISFNWGALTLRPHCIVHGHFKVKCPVSGAETRHQYVIVTCFYYVGTCIVSGMYCAVQNSNVW